MYEGLCEIRKKGIENILEELKHTNNEDKKSLMELSVEVQKELKRISVLQIQEIHSDIKDEIDEEIQNKIKCDINKPEIKFMLQVFLPCFLLYRGFSD